MHNESCDHNWEMVNIKPGYIMTETCHKCDLVTTYFSYEDNPPLEEYRSGDHFFNVMTSAQSVTFDLRCRKCHTVVTYRELSSLMFCTGCDKGCRVARLMEEERGRNVSVFVAFGFKPEDEKSVLSGNQVSILEDYFNQGRQKSSSVIKIVSPDMIDSMEACEGEYLLDTGMLSLTPEETK